MGVSTFADMDKFSERLKDACRRAGVEWGPTALGAAFEVAKQTAERWMGESQPSAQKLFDIADKLKVDPRWLATGEEKAVTVAGLPSVQSHELDLLARYRSADPRWQLCLRLMAALATEDQIEFAGDVNVIIARLMGKKPADVRYTANERVAAAYGPVPVRKTPLVSVDERNKLQKQDSKVIRRTRR